MSSPPVTRCGKGCRPFDCTWPDCAWPDCIVSAPPAPAAGPPCPGGFCLRGDGITCADDECDIASGVALPPPAGDPRTSTPGVTDADLVKRAVIAARPRRFGAHPRWVAIMDTFALGSGYAHALCNRYNLDPEERIKR